jgi:hypothetical protein
MTEEPKGYTHVFHSTIDDGHRAEEPEIGVQIVEPNELDVCTWTDDVDEKRRAFVVNQMANSDVDGKVLVQNMHAVCEWLKSGALPVPNAIETFAKPKVVKYSE